MGGTVMRKLTLVLACVVAVVASQDCLAAHGLRIDLGRRDTTLEQFQQDRDICVAKVIARARHSSRADHRRTCQYNQDGLPPVALNPPPTDFHGYRGDGTSEDYRSGRQYHLADDLFIECMRAKGYTRVPESTGFRAGPLWR
jgi:hypothetical protein